MNKFTWEIGACRDSSLQDREYPRGPWQQSAIRGCWTAAVRPKYRAQDLAWGAYSPALGARLPWVSDWLASWAPDVHYAHQLTTISTFCVLFRVIGYILWCFLLLFSSTWISNCTLLLFFLFLFRKIQSSAQKRSNLSLLKYWLTCPTVIYLADNSCQPRPTQ